MKLSTCLSIALCTLVAVTPVNSQVAKKGSGYLMRFKYTKGQVLKYMLTSSTTMAGQKQPFKMDMPFTMTVKEVKNGVATIETKVDTSSIQKGSKPQIQTIKIDNMGNVVGGGSNGQLAGTNLPKDPVAMGGSWKAKAAMAQGANANATYTLKGIKNIGGKSVAEVAFKLDASGGMQMAGNGTMYMMVSDCSLYSMSMNMAMSQGANKANTTMTMRRTN